MWIWATFLELEMEIYVDGNFMEQTKYDIPDESKNVKMFDAL